MAPGQPDAFEAGTLPQSFGWRKARVYALLEILNACTQAPDPSEEKYRALKGVFCELGILYASGAGTAGGTDGVRCNNDAPTLDAGERLDRAAMEHIAPVATLLRCPARIERTPESSSRDLRARTEDLCRMADEIVLHGAEDPDPARARAIALLLAMIDALLLNPGHRLASYGSLAPGKPNHWMVAGIPGTWAPGVVYGELSGKGWGTDIGFPGLRIAATGDPVPVQVLQSRELPLHWPRLDAFEGADYSRVIAPVSTGQSMMLASLYVLSARL